MLPAETRLMCAVGLGAGVAYWQGAQSARSQRVEAARLLPEKLEAEGYELDEDLLILASKVARNEQGDTLRATYSCIAGVIRYHLTRSQREKEELLEDFGCYTERRSFLRRGYDGIIFDG